MNAALSIFNRLTVNEMIALRRATQDGIAHLAQNAYRGDMIIREIADADREAVLTEVQTLVNENFSARSAAIR